MTNANIFETQIDQLTEFFPKLKKVTSEDNMVIVRGELDVIDQDGKFWETYQVEIHPCDGFPYCFSLVFEMGRKIPRIADWHVYEDTQSCCIAVEPQEYLICRNGISLADFVLKTCSPVLL